MSRLNKIKEHYNNVIDRVSAQVQIDTKDLKWLFGTIEEAKEHLGTIYKDGEVMIRVEDIEKAQKWLRKVGVDVSTEFLRRNSEEEKGPIQ